LAGLAEPDRLDGVLCWNQFSVAAANALAARWSLPRMWNPQRANLVEKLSLHRLWVEAGIWVPHTTVVADGAPATLPVVVKPNALAGGIGVLLCRSEPEFRRHTASFRAAVAGTGVDAWVGSLLDRHGLSTALLAQRYVAPDPLPDVPCREFSADFVVQAGRSRLLGMSGKTHVGAPYFAESALMIPVPDKASGVLHDVLPQVQQLVDATGMEWGFAHVEFCLAGGRVVPFECNPRIIGDPGAQMLARVHELDIVDLLVATAIGQTTQRRRHLPRAGLEFLFDIRAPLSANGHRFEGLDLVDPPVTGDVRLDVQAIVAAGDVVEVSAIRGPKRVATVVVAAPDEHTREQMVKWVAQPARYRVGQRPTTRRGELRCSLSADLPDQPTWSSLTAREDVQTTWQWMTAVERMPGCDVTRFVLVHDDVGLVGATPLWVVNEHVSSSHRPPTRPSRADVGQRRLLLAGSRAGYTAAWLVARELPEPDRVAVSRVMLDLIRAYGRHLGCDDAWVVHAATDTVRLLTEAGAMTPGLPCPPVAELDLGGFSYDEWCDAAPIRQRQTVRRERRLFQRSAMTLVRDTLTDHVMEAGRLLAQHQHKFGAATSPAAMADYLRALAGSFGDQAQVMLLRDGTATRAFSLLLVSGGSVDVRVYGADPLPATEAAYYRLTVHEPVQHALRRGIGRITLGPGTYGSKLRHGARLSARWAVQILGAPPTADQQRSYVDRTRQELAEEGHANAFEQLYGFQERNLETA
jgi:predicted N-acyltransferase